MIKVCNIHYLNLTLKVYELILIWHGNNGNGYNGYNNLFYAEDIENKEQYNQLIELGITSRHVSALPEKLKCCRIRNPGNFHSFGVIFIVSLFHCVKYLGQLTVNCFLLIAHIHPSSSWLNWTIIRIIRYHLREYCQKILSIIEGVMMYAVSFVLLSFITCIGAKGRVQKSSKNNSNFNVFDLYNF